MQVEIQEEKGHTEQASREHVRRSENATRIAEATAVAADPTGAAAPSPPPEPPAAAAARFAERRSLSEMKSRRAGVEAAVEPSSSGLPRLVFSSLSALDSISPRFRQGRLEKEKDMREKTARRGHLPMRCICALFCFFRFASLPFHALSSIASQPRSPLSPPPFLLSNPLSPPSQSTRAPFGLRKSSTNTKRIPAGRDHLRTCPPRGGAHPFLRPCVSGAKKGVWCHLLRPPADKRTRSQH